MKRILTAALFVATLSLGTFGMTGCAVIQDFLNNSDAISQAALNQGDQQALNTIAPDFIDYAEADTDLTTDTLNLYKTTVHDWGRTGSTWVTYEVIVGEDLGGPYVVYFEEDESLDQSDRNARYGNIEAWKLNLESRLSEFNKNETKF